MRNEVYQTSGLLALNELAIASKRVISCCEGGRARVLFDYVALAQMHAEERGNRTPVSGSEMAVIISNNSLTLIGAGR
jgi:hypothetical protein